MNLNNKTIILTGASRIGKIVAQELLLKNVSLVVSYLTAQPEFNFSFDLNKVLFVQGNLTKPEDIKNLVFEAKKKFVKIDGLVHMAATYNRIAWDKLNELNWDESLNTIAKSTFLLSKAVGDELLKNKGEPIVSAGQEVGLIKGKIITIADWSVFIRPYKDFLAYNVAKTAVMGLTKSLAKELAPYVLVNSIAPGPILKPEGLSDNENEEVIKNTPVAHWGGAEEIAKAIMYLLDADFVTGQILYVDGGRSIG